MLANRSGIVGLALRLSGTLSLCIIGCVTLPGCDTPTKPMPASANAFLEAQKLLAAGEKEKALEALNSSITDDPSTWALFMRAKLLLEKGDEAAALKDCETGLQIEPNDTNLAWLKGELAKPASARFQGTFKEPPARAR